jgi:regulation of enolase protein 1 (concanavalin A-like superfamily)
VAEAREIPLRSFEWLTEPPACEIRASGCRFRVAAGTDFWRQTETGHVQHNGHLLHAPAPGAFDLTADVSASLAARYDQLGVMAAATATAWVKAGVERDGNLWLSAVNTQGTSDWSREPAPGFPVRIRLRRESDALSLEIFEARAWRTFRILTFPGPLEVGLYACAPKGPGFDAEFEHVRYTAEHDRRGGP